MKLIVLKILKYLDEFGWSTPDVIAIEFDMTTNEVAQHLGILKRTGLVMVEPRQRVNGNFRPAIYCSTSERGMKLLTV